MRLKVEIEKDFTGFIINYLINYEIIMVAFEEKEEFNVLYFDQFNKNENDFIIKKTSNEPVFNPFFEGLNSILEPLKHFKLSFVDLEESLSRIATARDDFDEIYIEADIISGAVFPLDAIIKIEMRVINKLEDEISLIIFNDSIFSLSIKDIANNEMTLISTPELVEPKKISIKRRMVHRQVLTFQLNFNSSKYTQFVLQANIQLNGKEKNCVMSPITVLFRE